MSVTTTSTRNMEDTLQSQSQKRKRIDQVEELEIDINAAEPPSKKQLRKAKKSKTTNGNSKSVVDNVNVKEMKTKQSEKEGTKENDNATKQSSNLTRSKYGIWIGNLSFTTSKNELMTFMTSDTDHPIEESQITRIHLPSGQTRAGKPQNKGFAYIDFSDVVALNHALQLSEKLFGGRRVLIKDAKSFEGRPASKEDVAAGKAPSRRIFVGNLSFDTTSEALEKHFSVCGKIQKIQVATFEDSGKCKGYAWVEFEQLSSAESAMRGWVEQDNDDSVRVSKRRIWLKKMEGRQLRMEFAEDATTRYNKRYGKEAKVKKYVGEEGETQQLPIEEVNNTEPRQKRGGEVRKGGYEKETVQRLTGAMVEGQGQKVTFD